ncbi:antitoxin of toxin-antitoxin stability system, partial [Escherichia coli]|nr:antitoxin of toxin-antitoxin stability system [Escherichia coli]HAZ8183313.1 antitoxin of toxin-antitoxin stability system [Escherichia coli]
MHRILAEKSVNITELRKNPAKYFIDQPVAVLSNNRPAGYLLSASAFEA